MALARLALLSNQKERRRENYLILFWSAQNHKKWKLNLYKLQKEILFRIRQQEDSQEIIDNNDDLDVEIDILDSEDDSASFKWKSTL